MSVLRVTIIQTDLHWEDRAANRDMLERKINSIIEKTEVVLLPEMFSTGFSMRPADLAEKMNGTTLEWMKKIATDKRVILGGSLIIEEDGKYYNRFIWMLPGGDYGTYDKRHLFAYGGEDADYTRGNRRLIASVKGWKVNPMICYDLRFPVWSRQTPGETFEYDLLTYVANWPERRITAWKTLLRARAIENQCYVIGVNRTGVDGNGLVYPGGSMIIDPLGEILYEKDQVKDIFTCTLEKSRLEEIRKILPFWKDADPFTIG